MYVVADLKSSHEVYMQMYIFQVRIQKGLRIYTYIFTNACATKIKQTNNNFCVPFFIIIFFFLHSSALFHFFPLNFSKTRTGGGIHKTLSWIRQCVGMFMLHQEYPLIWSEI